jgi:hypothetical protein
MPPFRLLHSIEVQLVYQWCDARSKLQLAKTCRQMMSDCAHPLSWQHADLVCFNSAHYSLAEPPPFHPQWSRAPLALWQRCLLHFLVGIGRGRSNR